MPVRNSQEPSELGRYLKARREELGLGIREVTRLSDLKLKACGARLSPGYVSQVESGWADPEKVSGDFLWAIGIVLEVSLELLWVLARPKIDRRYLSASERRKVFRIDSVAA